MSALVAGMIAGADSIDDMALLRHGAMGALFDQPYSPSTLGSFLREFTFGHVRQRDAVATRVLARLADRTPLLAGIVGPVLVEIVPAVGLVGGDGIQAVSWIRPPTTTAANSSVTATAISGTASPSALISSFRFRSMHVNRQTDLRSRHEVHHM